MVALQTIEVPGYREAVQRERALRDSAFLDTEEQLCGVTVKPLSLRKLIELERAHNGFICPWRWASDAEVIGHAMALIYFCQPNFRPPAESFWSLYLHGYRKHKFCVGLLRRLPPLEIIKAVRQWLDDAFMDAPSGGGDNIASQSYASYPAYIMDKFGEAGLTYTPDQIMDMPLRRLWQHWRVAVARCNDMKLSNPSDEIAVAFISRTEAPK